MKKITGMMMAGAIGLTMAMASPVSADTLLGDYLKDKGVEVEISGAMDIYDKYIWRGFRLDGDTVMQPSVTIAAKGFEGGFWGSWDLSSNDGLAGDETDGWIGYSGDFGFIMEDLAMIGYNFGHTWYGFPEAGTYSKEVYVGLSVDTLLSPSFTWYGDYAEEENGGANGNYFMFDISHSFTLNEQYGITLDLGEEFSINHEAFIVGEGGYWLTTVGLTVPLSDHVTASPTMGYSIPYGDLKKGSDGNQKEEFYGGISLAFSF